jgi:hypothetical protein
MSMTLHCLIVCSFRPLLPLATIRIHEEDQSDPVVFAIHRNLLEYCSPYFKTFITSNPGNTIPAPYSGLGRPLENVVSHTIDLKGPFVVAFRLYTEWIYSGHIQKRFLQVETSVADDKSYHNMVHAYVLGETLEDHNFKNATVDCLLDTIHDRAWVDLTLPNLIYSTTSSRSPLRRLMVDLFILFGHEDWWGRDAVGAMSPTFASDMSTAWQARGGHSRINASGIDPCIYHEHKDDGNRWRFGRRHPREIPQPWQMENLTRQ